MSDVALLVSDRDLPAAVGVTGRVRHRAQGRSHRTGVGSVVLRGERRWGQRANDGSTFVERTSLRPKRIRRFRFVPIATTGCHERLALAVRMPAASPRGERRRDEWRAATSHRITLSNNIAAEGLAWSTHGKIEHSKGTLIHDNAADILLVDNLYAQRESGATVK